MRGGAHEALEIAARMQRLAAPIGGGEQRRLDLRPDRRACLVIVVVERVREDFLAEVAAVFRELLLRERLRPAHRLAVHAAPLAALAGAVLHGLHLHVVPVFRKRAEDAAVVRHLAVEVGAALPDAHGGEVGRLQRRHVPLVDGVVGNAVEPDLAVRPGLHAGPFDAVVEILGLARRPVVDVARRAAGAAGIDAHAGVIVRHPFFRIDHFPALIEVARTGGDIRMLFGHALPGARIAVLEGEALGIGAVAEDDRDICRPGPAGIRRRAARDRRPS